MLPGGDPRRHGIGWWKELLGGAVTVASLVAFYIWHLASSGNLAAGPYFALFASPGFLFLLAGLLKQPGLREAPRMAAPR